jgi:hypothetical protein
VKAQDESNAADNNIAHTVKILEQLLHSFIIILFPLSSRVLPAGAGLECSSLTVKLVATLSMRCARRDHRAEAFDEVEETNHFLGAGAERVPQLPRSAFAISIWLISVINYQRSHAQHVARFKGVLSTSTIRSGGLHCAATRSGDRRCAGEVGLG